MNTTTYPQMTEKAWLGKSLEKAIFQKQFLMEKATTAQKKNQYLQAIAVLEAELQNVMRGN
jgi:hypothetical protein